MLPPQILTNQTTTRGTLTFCIDPIRIYVWQRRLIAHVLNRFRWLLIYQAARTPPPTLLAVIHLLISSRS